MGNHLLVPQHLLSVQSSAMPTLKGMPALQCSALQGADSLDLIAPATLLERVTEQHKLDIRLTQGVNGPSVAAQHYYLCLPDSQKVIGAMDQCGLIEEPITGAKRGQVTLA